MWKLIRRFFLPPPPVAEESELRPCGKCLVCVRNCPSGALQYRNRMWHIDLSRCISCAGCAQICPNGLISIRTAAGQPPNG